ncbi:hypothetical protein LX97_01310 [Nonlabens dokdonensis]|jgi:hypothetical protein|uniref:Uncharacterized protein n=1 Tax=Nonlabens dokdonensis TaxID=328515 RepID=A0ABX5Q2L9_9FLAO|nr:hypothetical protein LX97_01310 [Nonlabens dokdonensis]
MRSFYLLLLLFPIFSYGQTENNLEAEIVSKIEQNWSKPINSTNWGLGAQKAFFIEIGQ